MSIVIRWSWQSSVNIGKEKQMRLIEILFTIGFIVTLAIWITAGVMIVVTAF
jgi:hypothetical protein